VEFQEVIGAVLYIGGSYVVMRRDSFTNYRLILSSKQKISCLDLKEGENSRFAMMQTEFGRSLGVPRL
jgi:hypothetical protein